MLSLCMIVKDEGHLLKDFLKRVSPFVDEIIIANTGSKDKTKETATKFTKKVYDFRWNDDFAAARNFSVSKATKGWILVLDPDEIIDKKDMIKIKTIIEDNKDKKIMGFRLIQKTLYKNKVISIRGICRLFRNDKRISFIYPIHETVRESIKNLGGRIGKTGITIKHYPKISKEKQDYYVKLLKKKKLEFPLSNAEKEIENEMSLFNP